MPARIMLPAITRQIPRTVRPASRPLYRSIQPVRQIHTTRPTRAQYERFDRGFKGPTGPSGRPDWRMFLRRRFGSDRAIYLYGIGIGGAGIYYVTHLERVPETGRLRFIDVSEASEREASGLESQFPHVLIPAWSPDSIADVRRIQWQTPTAQPSNHQTSEEHRYQDHRSV